MRFNNKKLKILSVLKKSGEVKFRIDFNLFSEYKENLQLNSGSNDRKFSTIDRFLSIYFKNRNWF
tara:strand:- start:203 stop:397 length:195 start_codon:yes stop_codon:yes gene_type:complete